MQASCLSRMEIACYKQSVCIPEKLLPQANQLMADLQIYVNVEQSMSFHCRNSNLLIGPQW